MGGLLLLPSLLDAKPTQQPPCVGFTVQTESGPIVGHVARNRTDILEFLGIPYAQPPLGQLRFAAPQKFASTVLFNASAYVGPPSGKIDYRKVEAKKYFRSVSVCSRVSSLQCVC